MDLAVRMERLMRIRTNQSGDIKFIHSEGDNVRNLREFVAAVRYFY